MNHHTGNVQPAIDLEEHVSKGGLNAKRVVPYTYDPTTDTLIPDGQANTSRYDLQSPVYYVGSAPAGSNESDPVWNITKYDLTSNPSSGKVAQNVAWSGRIGASYV